jgi:hypothetical protein
VRATKSGNNPNTKVMSMLPTSGSKTNRI